MGLKFFSSRNSFSILTEIFNFKSKEYSSYKKNKNSRHRNRFFSEKGNFLDICHIFRKILQLNLSDTRFEKTILYGANTKKSLNSKLVKFNNILELWLFSNENFQKRICLIFFKGEGDVWQFEFIKKIQKHKVSLKLVLLFGSSIWIVDIPVFLSQFLVIKNPLIKINLGNLFQWKMTIGRNLIFTGDIYSKITIVNLTKTLKAQQIIHNREENNPVGDLKFIEFNYENSGLLISGGFDGTLKIWSISKKIILLKEIQFNKRWLVDLDFTLFKEDYLLVFVSLENGFMGIISFYDKIKIVKKYSNQGNLRITNFLTDYTINIGNDGYINLIEINAPIANPLNVLDLLNNPSFFFNWGIKPKLNNTLIQSIGIKYQSGNSRVYLNDLNKIIFSFSGFHGVMLFFGLERNLA